MAHGVHDVPDTRYARSEGVHIAYQVAGEGPIDLVFVPGWISHVELAWEFPPLARFLRRLASFSRLILFDKRGTGMSDHVPVSELPSLEQRMDDVRAVMDAVGSDRAALLGLSEGGPMNLLFAATYPDRTRATILLSSFARILAAPDYPWGASPAFLDAFLARVESDWGTGVGLGALAPSSANDPAVRRLWARFQRMAASPGTAVHILRMASETDARSVLSSIRVPALVVHRTGDRFIPVEHGRYLAEHIPRARLVELPGDDHLPQFGDSDAVLDEIQEFLTGVRGADEPERVLTTVLFTDIVDSTARASELGDRRWRDLLESYHLAVRRELRRFRGREVDTAGDGFFASFDGPARAIRCAHAIAAAARGLGVEIRAGVHTGECELLGDKISGIAVHLGARVASAAGAGEVLVSQTVRDLVAGSGIVFEDRGVRALKGIPDQWRLFTVKAA
jgi:pimeloyl-ACP methyl ester carboxylesterase